jgi:hypothetical protein
MRTVSSINKASTSFHAVPFRREREFKKWMLTAAAVLIRIHFCKHSHPLL